MPVERRDAARQPVDLPVHIRYRRRRFLAATARELSSDGMTLAVQSLTLPAGTPIELEFRGLGKSWLLAAVVIHGDNSGIGVRFRDRQPELFRGLTQAATAPPPVLAGTAGEPLPHY